MSNRRIDSELFQLWLHESETVSSRTEWFLIFHAILFEAFLNKDAPGSHRIIVGLFGSLVSFLWLGVGLRQWWHIKYYNACIKNEALMKPALAAFFDIRAKHRVNKQPRLYRWANATPSFAIVIPFACWLCWIAFLLFDDKAQEIILRDRGYPSVVLAFVLCLVLAPLFIRWLGKRPALDEKILMKEMVAEIIVRERTALANSQRSVGTE